MTQHDIAEIDHVFLTGMIVVQINLLEFVRSSGCIRPLLTALDTNL